MENKIQINISYYGVGQGSNFKTDYKNSNEFIDSISDDFDVKINRKRGGLGGGNFDFVIDFYINHPVISTIAINIASNFLGSFLKNQFKSFFDNLKKLKEENKDWNDLDVGRIKLEFDDVVFFIYLNEFQTLDSKIYLLVQKATTSIPFIISESKNQVKEIHIPVVFDKLLKSDFGFESHYTIPFRMGYQEVDSSIDFYRDWGIIFKAKRDKIVFNSETREILNTTWRNPSEDYS